MMATLNAVEPGTGQFKSASSIAGASGLSEAPPLFTEALDKIAVACIPQLEKLAGAEMTVTCAMTTMTIEAAGDVIIAVDPIAVTGFIELPAQSTRLLVSLDHDLVQLVIELMCGGLCGEPSPSAPRPGTGIDRQFARVVFNLLASTIDKTCQSFGLGPVGFGQIETKLDPSALGRRTNKVFLATFAVGCKKRRAHLRIAFPQPVVDRFRQDILPAGKELSTSDPVWTEHFQAEIGRAAVRLDAYLDAGSLSLGDISVLRVGQILPLPKTAPSRCELRSETKRLFRCELGQAEGRYSLRVEETSPDEVCNEVSSSLELSSLFS